MRISRIIGSLLCCGFVATTAASPVVTQLAEASVPCNGYLEIQGSGFETEAGLLTVNGRPAPAAGWSDTEIIAYVPLGVGAGTAQLSVTTASGASAALDFEIQPCAPVEPRISWRQRFDTSYFHARPVVGPDGTIYVLDLAFRLYALEPTGHVRWVVDGSLPAEPGKPVFGNTSITVDQAGNIYSAHKWYVTSLYPDGRLRWRYDIDAAARSYIVYDTKIGPDGNLYVAACHTPTADALGVYSMTPEGALRWNVAHPYDRTTRKQIELVFANGPDGHQLYFSANQNSYAITLEDGNVVFDNLPQVTGFAAASPVSDSVHSSNYSYLPDGTIEWQSPVFLNGAMAFDSQGIHFATTSLGGARIVALDTDGSQRYETALSLPPTTSPDTTSVTPDDSLLLVHDISNRLLALDSASGNESWRIELAPEEVSESFPNGFVQYWQRRPAFNAAGTTAYYLSAVNAAGVIPPRAFLNAVAPDGAWVPPSMAIWISTASAGAAGKVHPMFHLTDPNDPSQVTGYNAYRSDSPDDPASLWPLMATDAGDEEPGMPQVQWTDTSADVSPTGIWYYQITAYNSGYPAEGPF